MRLREVREDRQLTQREVAERMGVTEQRIGAIERNEIGNLKVGTLKRYLAALGGLPRVEVQFGPEVAWVRLRVD